jgi:signal transduction histidine kinase/DNA-binding response OmpR family regulator
MKQAPSHTILAVNDRTDKLESLTSIIALAEYTVLKATNINAAVRLAIKQHPDLIIIDVSKEQIALDLHRRIRSTQKLADTPILLIGTKANHDFATDSMKDDLLETPYQPITLAAKAARLVERKRIQNELRPSQSLLQAERRAITEYKTLLERIAHLAEVLAAARRLEQIFNALLEFTKISIRCDALIIALYDHEQGELTPHFLWLEGQKIDLTNADLFPLTNNSDIQYSDRKLIFQDSSSIIVPMTIMGRTIGILEIHSFDTDDPYQKEDTVAVQMAANLATNTIENVRLLNREREQETQLRQAQKMEAIGQLAGGVAHDFNNFVTTMYGLCDGLLRGLQQSDPLRSYVFEMKQSATRVANLTKQLLAFGRKQVLQPQKLNLNTVVTQIMDQFLARTIGEHISIISNLADDLPEIIADRSQLEQIVINLAVNARDAIRNVGTITIETSVVYHDRKQARKQTINRNYPLVQLSISDTGIGMSPDLQKRIFEPFFTTKGEGGTGLGLSTVYGCVKQSGGSISVDSKEGQGTTFHIQFPVAKDDSSEVTVDTIPDAVDELHGTQTILIAEDDTSLRHVLKEELSNAGYTIIEAINGADAWELFKQHNERIQLVITDVLMPKMNGRDLALLISDIQSDVHVLYISGYPKDVITEHGVLREEVNFLAKPFDGNDLLNTVRQIFTEQDVVH